MAYELQVERRARKVLERLPGKDYERIAGVIDTLAHDPRPRGTRKLQGPAPLWRMRVGDYRIIYSIFDTERIVKVVRIGRRSERTYEDLS